MPNFDKYLKNIAYDLRDPLDKDDKYDFKAVMLYIFNIMRQQNSYFNKICREFFLFGSMANDVRLIYEDEFDVVMEFEFPAYEDILITNTPIPGYVILRLLHLQNMPDLYIFYSGYNILSPLRLKSWINKIFKGALERYGDVVEGCYEEYKLTYCQSGVAYKIKAKSDSRTFHIHFVPAVKIVLPNSNTWVAVPKLSNIVNKLQNLSFKLGNIRAEISHIDRCDLKLTDTLRLLQALCYAKNLPKIKCYYLVVRAIMLIRRVGYKEIKNMSRGDLFLDLLWDLFNSFHNRHLPDLWDSRCNVFTNFSREEMWKYRCDLLDAYSTLYTYEHQPKLSYKRCMQHFEW